MPHCGPPPCPAQQCGHYDASGTRSRHQKLLRGYLHIRPVDANTITWLEALATDAAHTKVELPDIVNVLIEELIRVRCELPPLACLHRMATQARSRCNEAIYRAISEALDGSQIGRIEALFDG